LADLARNELIGRTLKVYINVVRHEPVGPREIMRTLNFTSPSVAYRHLQKLETMNLIEKNDFGNYVVKEKVSIRGFVWLGKRLVPNALVYASIFSVALLWELIVFVIHFSVETDQFKIFFILLTIVTVTALILFAIEGLRSLKRINSVS
jgi:predicted transcriptional regulator